MKSWREHACIWVVGSIDASGHIDACASREGITHTQAQKGSTCFRWCIWSQEFYHLRVQPRYMNDDELFAVLSWLLERGYTDVAHVNELCGNSK